METRNVSLLFWNKWTKTIEHESADLDLPENGHKVEKLLLDVSDLTFFCQLFKIEDMHPL